MQHLLGRPIFTAFPSTKRLLLGPQILIASNCHRGPSFEAAGGTFALPLVLSSVPDFAGALLARHSDFHRRRRPSCRGTVWGISRRRSLRVGIRHQIGCAPGMAAPNCRDCFRRPGSCATESLVAGSLLSPSSAITVSAVPKHNATVRVSGAPPQSESRHYPGCGVHFGQVGNGQLVKLNGRSGRDALAHQSDSRPSRTPGLDGN